MTGDTTKIFNAIDTVEEPEVKALRERLIERVRNAVKGDTPVDQIPGLHLVLLLLIDLNMKQQFV